MVAPNSFVMANVWHKRLRPAVNDFNYKVFYLCFPLSQMAKLKNVFFSINRWNLMSFHARDHGPRDGSDLTLWIKGILADHNIIGADGEIMLFTLPRILGYVFNPVSFWFCLDAAGQVRAVLSEVRNTYGEHHSYISYHEDHRAILSGDWLRSEKAFYVSPFIDVTGFYKFRFDYNELAVTVVINHSNEDGPLLNTSVSGRMQAITTRRTLACFFLCPLVTLKVIAMIHVEAVRLLIKGIRRRAKPLAPLQEVTR